MKNRGCATPGHLVFLLRTLRNLWRKGVNFFEHFLGGFKSDSHDSTFILIYRHKTKNLWAGFCRKFFLLEIWAFENGAEILMIQGLKARISEQGKDFWSEIYIQLLYGQFSIKNYKRTGRNCFLDVRAPHLCESRLFGAIQLPKSISPTFSIRFS